MLVKIMFDYGLRDMFKNEFETLHMRFYQLERMLEVWVRISQESRSLVSVLC